MIWIWYEYDMNMMEYQIYIYSTHTSYTYIMYIYIYDSESHTHSHRYDSESYWMIHINRETIMMVATLIGETLDRCIGMYGFTPYDTETLGSWGGPRGPTFQPFNGEAGATLQGAWRAQCNFCGQAPWPWDPAERGCSGSLGMFWCGESGSEPSYPCEAPK